MSQPDVGQLPRLGNTSKDARISRIGLWISIACDVLTKIVFSMLSFVFCGAGVRESAYGTRV